MAPKTKKKAAKKAPKSAFDSAFEAFQTELRALDSVEAMQDAQLKLADETNVLSQILQSKIAEEGAPA